MKCLESLQVDRQLYKMFSLPFIEQMGLNVSDVKMSIVKTFKKFELSISKRKYADKSLSC